MGVLALGCSPEADCYGEGRAPRVAPRVDAGDEARPREAAGGAAVGERRAGGDGRGGEGGGQGLAGSRASAVAKGPAQGEGGAKGSGEGVLETGGEVRDTTGALGGEARDTTGARRGEVRDATGALGGEARDATGARRDGTGGLGEERDATGRLLGTVAPAGVEGGARVDARGDRREACLRRNARAPRRYAGVVRALCADHHNLGGVAAAVVVAERGAIRLVATAGEECAGGRAVSGSTVFRVGSLTKAVTAGLALTFVDEAALELDASIARVVPELAEGVDDRAAAITLRHLLAHTSGLPDRPPRPGDDVDGGWLRDLGEFPLWAAPGEVWSYSNSGYGVAGLALERVGGAPYRDLVEARLLAPLGLGVGGGREGCGRAPAEGAWTVPAGGLALTGPAMVELALGLSSPVGSPISLAGQEEWRTPVAATGEHPGESYALGMRTRALGEGEVLLVHLGNTGDASAELLVAPARGFAALVVGDGAEPLRATGLAVLRDLLGAEPMTPAQALPAFRYAGRYWPPEWEEPLVVRAGGGSLAIESGVLGLADVRLEALGDHRFRAVGRPELGAFTFLFGEDKRVPGYVRTRLLVAERID